MRKVAQQIRHVLLTVIENITIGGGSHSQVHGGERPVTRVGTDRHPGNMNRTGLQLALNLIPESVRRTVEKSQVRILKLLKNFRQKLRLVTDLLIGISHQFYSASGGRRFQQGHIAGPHDGNHFHCILLCDYSL